MNTQMALSRRHACVSFAAPETLPLVAEVCQSFILDNGAFTAWKQGTPLDIDGFMVWAETWLRHPGCEWALIPDLIDGDEAQNDALLSLVNGYGWVPIWHLHESLERLERLCEWPRVALGSSGEYAEVGSGKWWGRIAEAMDVCCDDDGIPLTKLHGLRMLDPTVFSRLPFASADSTNVARNIGIDGRWKGPYSPQTRATRALLMMERIEVHASASRWCREAGVGHNGELFG